MLAFAIGLCLLSQVSLIHAQSFFGSAVNRNGLNIAEPYIKEYVGGGHVQVIDPNDYLSNYPEIWQILRKQAIVPDTFKDEDSPLFGTGSINFRKRLRNLFRRPSDLPTVVFSVMGSGRSVNEEDNDEWSIRPVQLWPRRQLALKSSPSKQQRRLNLMPTRLRRVYVEEPTYHAD